MFVSPRAFVFVFSLLVASACTDAGRALEGSLGVVEVIETPPPIALEPTPAVIADAPLVPELIYAEPLPLPPRHVVRVQLEPSGMRSLSEVQSVEVAVEIEGGALGARKIQAVFVSPTGLAWEKQLTWIEGKRGQTQVAHFSLPVAATFISEQQLAGQWQVTTLDEGVEQASANFALEE